MKKNNKKSCYSFLVCFVLLVMFTMVSANADAQHKTDSVYRKNGMQRIARDISANGWVHFKDSIKFDRTMFFHEHKKEFGLSKDDQLKEHLRNIDGDMVHVKYKQTYKGIPVEFSMVIAHSRNGEIKSVNGTPVLSLDMDINPKISESDAIEFAIAHVNAQKYAWQVKGTEVSNYPKAQLVILPESKSKSIDRNYLAYKIDIHAVKPVYSASIYIDANTGKIIYVSNKIMNAYTSVPATANTQNYGQVNILTNRVSSNLYRLRATKPYVNESGVIFYVDFETYNGEGYVDFTNTSTTWQTPNKGTDAQYEIEKTLDFYNNNFKRVSFDNNGAAVKVHVGCDLSYIGPSVGGVWFGDKQEIETPLNDYPNLSVICHEFTHGVSQYSGLGYADDDSRAINEGFSYFFGNCSEKYYNPNYGYFPHPAWASQFSYKGTQWNATDNYHHCKLFTHFSYLLLSGVTNYVNEAGVQTNISFSALNQADVYTLAYKVLTNYVVEDQDFPDLADCYVDAALNYYGITTATTVFKAWKAVGVIGTNYSSLISTNTLSGNLASALYVSASSITTSGVTSVNNGIYTRVISHTQIKLENGFNAFPGCTFDASITPPIHQTSFKSAFVSDEVQSNALQNTTTTIIGNDNAKDEITLYPNPTSGQLILENSGASPNVSVSIVDLSGKIIFAGQTSQSRFEMDISHAANGIYIVQINTGKEVIKKKIVKQ